MANQKKINAIEELTQDRLIEALSDPETATPGMIQCALRYLGDAAKEGAVIEPGSKVEQILENLPFKMTGTDD